MVYLILSAVPLLLGTLILFIMTYYFIVKKSREISKVKYVLLLIVHYMCGFILASILAVWMDVFDHMWPYVIIVEFINVPVSFALCRYIVNA